LDRREQMALAGLVREKRVRLVATGPKVEGELCAELNAALLPTTIELVPLRERHSDIARWFELFLEAAAAGTGTSPVTVSPEAAAAVRGHDWPGNLAELEAVVKRAVLLSKSRTVNATDLGLSAEQLEITSLKEATERFRQRYVRDVLEHFEGNRTQAARALGVDPRTVFRFIAKAKKGD